MQTVQGRVFIITGGGGAIARPIARAFAGAGAKLALVDRTVEHGAEAAAEVGGVAIGADLGRAAGAAEMVAAARARWGRVDGLIHTVGGYASGALAEVAEAQYDQMFDLNVRTLFHAVRAVLPSLAEQGGGFLAAFSSEPARTGAAPGASLYAAAKSAVATLLRSLDGELGAAGPDVAIVYPMGAVDTPANRRAMPDADPARWIDPAEIAAAILFAATRGPRGRLTELAIHPPRR
jgi:NADP-dependent 3-hydroxy acid dehydrogenase YdfG